MEQQSKLTPMGWIRLSLYIISGAVGLGAVVTNALGYVDLGVLLGTIAGAGAAITGGTASYNLPKAPDQHRTGGFDVLAALPAIDEIARAARTYREAMAYQGRHQLEEEPVDYPAEEPRAISYSGYIRQVRGE